MPMIKEIVNRFRWVLMGLLSIPAGISLKAGMHGAISSSQDFQWSGASLLRHGIDPWKNALLGQSASVSHFSQPGCLHMFYVLLLPFSRLSFQHAAEAWCILNILLSIAAIFLLKNLFSLSRFVSIGMLFLLWMSSSFRSTLRLGQTSIFELVLLCLVFCTTNSTIRGLALGFSFSEYSFAPVVLSFLWFKHNIRTLTIAVIVAVLAVALTWSMLGGSILQVAFEPFAVSNLTPRSGTADLVTSIEAALARWLPAFRSGQTLAYAAGLMASGAYGLFLSRRRISNGGYLTLISIASLFTIKHAAHDYVFLLLPLCYVFSERGKSTRAIAVPIVGVFWFMDGLFAPLPSSLTRTADQWITSAAASCMLATLLVYLTWSILRTEVVPHIKRAENDRRVAHAAETFSAI
jgi:hypothetical protein